MKLLNDKKFALVKYMREQCAALAPGVAGPPSLSAEAMPPPVHMGGAQVLQTAHAGPAQQMGLPAVPPQMAERDLGAPMAPMPTMGATMDAIAATRAQQQMMMQGVAAVQHAHAAVAGGGAAPVVSEAMLKTVATLESAVSRLEESLNFAVECMQTDMAQCKEALQSLKAQLA